MDELGVRQMHRGTASSRFRRILLRHDVEKLNPYDNTHVVGLSQAMQ